MVRPAYHSLSLVLALGRFRYCILYLVCCTRLCLDLPAPYLLLFLGCKWTWHSCVNHILDRDGRGCGRCQTVWFSIFSCSRGRTSGINFLFFLKKKSFLGFSTSCERCGSACHVSDVQVQGLGSGFWFWFLSVTVQDEFMGYALYYVHVCITLRLLVVILGLDAGNIHEH